jgi:nitrogen fixation NifU-like protein
MSDDLRELYQEVILEHGKNPRNFQASDDATNEARGNNPLCGDQLVIYLKVDDDGRVDDASFLGKGCAISMASASMMTELVKGRTQAEAESLFEAFHDMCTGEENGHDLPEDVKKLRVLSGVREFPTRVKCATLPWHALVAALQGEDDISTE